MQGAGGVGDVLLGIKLSASMQNEIGMLNMVVVVVEEEKVASVVLVDLAFSLLFCQGHQCFLPSTTYANDSMQGEGGHSSHEFVSAVSDRSDWCSEDDESSILSCHWCGSGRDFWLG